MTQIPLLRPREVIRAFESIGWRVVRQRGSHIILSKPEHQATLSIPNHKKIARGTLRSLIRAAGLTVDEFVSLL